MITREFMLGMTRIVAHSPEGVMAMTAKQRQAWLRREWERGNPIVHRIVEATKKMTVMVEDR